jgi:RNA polymerase sigma-70 factor (ECF subfamily)
MMAKHPENEAALLAQAREGDSGAFGTLVNQYYAHVYRLALKITRNREDAEDAVQDAVLKAYSNLIHFQGNSRFYTWFVRIALNQALMKLRKTRSDKQVPLSDVIANDGENPSPVEFEDCNQNPEKQCQETELQEILSKALEGLGPHLARVFVLQNVQGFSARETAEILGLSAAAIKSRLVRVRLKLRRRLSKIFEPGLNSVDSATPSPASGRASSNKNHRMVLRPRTA